MFRCHKHAGSASPPSPPRHPRNSGVSQQGFASMGSGGETGVGGQGGEQVLLSLIGGGEERCAAGNLREPRRSTRATRVAGCPEALSLPGSLQPPACAALRGHALDEPAWPAPRPALHSPGARSSTGPQGPRSKGGVWQVLTITNRDAENRAQGPLQPARQPSPPEQSPGFRASRVSRCPRLIPISEQTPWKPPR